MPKVSALLASPEGLCTQVTLKPERGGHWGILPSSSLPPTQGGSSAGLCLTVTVLMSEGGPVCPLCTNLRWGGSISPGGSPRSWVGGGCSGHGGGTYLLAVVVVTQQ